MRGIVKLAASIILAAGATAGAGEARADEAAKRNAMKHIATVLAAVKLCPAIEADSTSLALVTLAAGFTFQADSAEGRMILADAAYQAESMKDTPQADICASALLLYGEGGMNVPGLVKKR